MRWPFTRRLGRATEKLIVEGLEVVGSQDGPHETELKEALIQLFVDDASVAKAYLARVRYLASDTVHVALCLHRPNGSSGELVEAVRKAFARRFSSDVHMDILFVGVEQDAMIAAACAPFFTR